MKTPLTIARIKAHLTYAWWQYALLAVLCVFGWNFFFTVSAYRPPEEKKITLYLYAYADTEPLQAWMNTAREERYPEQELFEVMQLSPDDSNGVVVLSTHLFSGEGDLIVLPRDQFYTYSRDGFFIPLEEIPGLTDAFAGAGINIDKGWRLLSNTESGEVSETRRLYGLSVKSIPLLSDAISQNTEFFIGIRIACGNEDTAVSVLKDLCLTNPDLAEHWTDEAEFTAAEQPSGV